MTENLYPELIWGADSVVKSLFEFENGHSSFLALATSRYLPAKLRLVWTNSREIDIVQPRPPLPASLFDGF